MLVAIVTFQLPKRLTREEAAAAFQGSASRYLGMAGLLRKNYWVSEDGMRAGGIYFWESRAHAEAVYNPDWRAGVTAKYGAEPRIEYVDSPVMVDNAAGRIVVD